jgi:hypothetical protein
MILIVSRASLIRICADHGYLAAHGLFTGMTEDGEKLSDASYHGGVCTAFT